MQVSVSVEGDKISAVFHTLVSGADVLFFYSCVYWYSCLVVEDGI
jgi:hypothetical protein